VIGNRDVVQLSGVDVSNARESYNAAQRIERWPLERLRPYAKNPRTHSASQINQIAASIRRFGFNNPILVDSEAGIIAGHGRLLAAEKLGLANVPVVVLDHLSAKNRRAYLLADNKLSENAGWDANLLAGELSWLQDEGMDLDVLGFSDEEVSALFDQWNSGTDDAEDEPPPLEEKSVSRSADLWELGPHRVLCGDSTDSAAVSQLMDGVEADLVFTDPPYNVAYEGKTRRRLRIENDSQSDEDFLAFLVRALDNAHGALREGGSLYICSSAGPTESVFRQAIEQVFQLRQCIVWVKDSFVLGRQDYHWRHESILYGWKDGAGHHFVDDRTQDTVWEVPRPKASRDHPTMKPVKLVERAIRNSSLRGGVVLDLFGGAGSTLIACERSARAGRLMEIDPRYVDVIVRRWSALTGKVPTLLASGESFDQVAASRARSVSPT